MNKIIIDLWIVFSKTIIKSIMGACLAFDLEPLHEVIFPILLGYEGKYLEVAGREIKSHLW